jgi:anaerobic selenocysteine-containing dehydrogenase
MGKNDSIKKIRSYCCQCISACPVTASVKDERFIAVKPDLEHPLATSLCPKGIAGPELVYNSQRLQYPMRRTNPKDASDPGWERISWDEALDAIASKLKDTKDRWGPEAVAFARSGFAGSQAFEMSPWILRLAHAFGTPNNIGTTHICQWHRDNCSSYTYGMPNSMGIKGTIEPEKTGCMLIWGNNASTTYPRIFSSIRKGLEQGAKLLVVDPRRTRIASMADLWLQVRPGTDGALALSIINVLMEKNLFDYDFIRDWTTAPFLVRSDNGDFLRPSDLSNASDPSSYVMVDSVSQSLMTFRPGKPPSTEPALSSSVIVKLVTGNEVTCNTAFKLLNKVVSRYSPSRAETITWVPEGKIRDAAKLLATKKPVSFCSWNGIEQSAYASQTNRAICILYALTGDYDKPGGNLILPRLPINSVNGREFLSPEIERKRLGFAKRPLGPAGTSGSIQGYEICKAILDSEPYPIKALFGFGGNIIMSHSSSSVTRQALSKLDFHVQAELFLSPTAQLADIVLPAASFWESWHVGVNPNSSGNKAYVQLRPAIVPPQHESWPDIKIVFQLARRLDLDDHFWNGSVKDAFGYYLAPSGITVEQLSMKPGGISIDLPVEHQKYRKKDGADEFVGFPTPSKRVEIYSQTFKDHGYDPLPAWEEPIFEKFAQAEMTERYPLIFICSKVLQYCHSQHRALPSLRKAVPHPFVEINRVKAREIDCKDGDWVTLESPHAAITLKAKITDRIPYSVVCSQLGWWQKCPELNLPGYDPYSLEGANSNLLYGSSVIDSISGSLPLKGYPCNIKKAEGMFDV